ncbi:tripartite tricarboxylate transporter substrate binding protein [Brevibacillus borstelensis]|uniref:tripartite tricarboxylate transporter substrate binding protein n=1 Tax=Brevibacillus borstelensis TaxID=45462 RepID=UPI00287FE9AA|nr:tripartite tricarboxylate transporter substrate binding protein [Brevibacillus borstelensis]WNF04748.1 tripartite tricarboxylate transporter substrate binding protein [Brevibacillus borstelensis]
MKLKSIFSGLAATALIASLVGCGSGNSSAPSGDQAAGEAEAYPKKQIELIVPYAAGGGTDAVARAFADSANKVLPQSIGVVNKTGGGGAVGMSEGAKAKPDGYKLTLVTVEMTTLPPLGLATFKPDDFKPVARLNADPAAITVSADAPWNTIEEFVAYAKENPGKVRIGNSGTGAIWHLAATALEQKIDTKFNHIPFDGANPAVTALLGGHIEAVSVSPAEVAAQVEAGKLKMLAVMADERLPKFKDVPTMKEKGIDLSIGTWRGIAVPKDTPDNVVTVLKDAAKKVTEDKAFTDVLEKMNLGVSYADDAAFSEAVKKDSELFTKLVSDLGLRK